MACAVQKDTRAATWSAVCGRTTARGVVGEERTYRALRDEKSGPVGGIYLMSGWLSRKVLREDCFSSKDVAIFNTLFRQVRETR